FCSATSRISGRWWERRSSSAAASTCSIARPTCARWAGSDDWERGMTRRVFLAGAGGAIGQPLVRLLADRGFKGFGTTRSPERAKLLKKLGAAAIVVDVFDDEALSRAAQDAEPEIVIHQLTDLAQGIDPERNARVRDVGTRNLVAAAREAGAVRLVAQSIA